MTSIPREHTRASARRAPTACRTMLRKRWKTRCFLASRPPHQITGESRAPHDLARSAYAGRRSARHQRNTIRVSRDRCAEEIFATRNRSIDRHHSRHHRSRHVVARAQNALRAARHLCLSCAVRGVEASPRSPIAMRSVLLAAVIRDAVRIVVLQSPCHALPDASCTATKYRFVCTKFGQRIVSNSDPPFAKSDDLHWSDRRNRKGHTFRRASPRCGTRSLRT